MSDYEPAQTMFGFKVFVLPDRPKMKLSPECPVTPDFRAEMDAWLLSFFGIENALKDGQSIVSETMRLVYVNPRTYQQLRSAVPSA